jgi:hypothetical protein
VLQGVPYWDEVLAQWPPISLVKARLNYAAKSVPGVVSATTFLTSFVKRRFTGQVQIKDENNTVTAAGF